MLTYPTPFTNTATYFPPLASYAYQGKMVMPQTPRGRSVHMDFEGQYVQLGLGNPEPNFFGFKMDTPYNIYPTAASWVDVCTTQWDSTDPNISAIRFDTTFSAIVKPGGDTVYLFGGFNNVGEDDPNKTAVVVLDLTANSYSINNNNTNGGNVKTAVFVSRHELVPLLGQEMNVWHGSMNKAGTRIICQDAYNNGNYRQLNLTIPWDITTLVDSGVSVPLTSTGLQGFGYVPPYGNEIYTFQASNKEIWRHKIPISWDLSSLPSDPVPYQTRSFKNEIGDAVGNGLHITEDRIFIYDDGTFEAKDNLHQYNVV